MVFVNRIQIIFIRAPYMAAYCESLEETCGLRKLRAAQISIILRF